MREALPKLALTTSLPQRTMQRILLVLEGRRLAELVSLARGRISLAVIIYMERTISETIADKATR
jgi:hypothetical protein